MTPPKSLIEVSQRIAVWRRWATTGRVWPQGYPERTVEARMREEAGVSGEGTKVVVPHPEAEEVERAIRSMPVELRRTFEEHYLGTRSLRRKCDILEVSYTEYFNRLRCAKYWLHGMLRI